jgi:hypothetical protein
MAKVEILGLEKLKSALNALPAEMRPAILRDIARKPAQRASAVARQLQPIGDTGATGRTIGVRKVSNPRHTFVEVGYRGRSLGHIYISAPLIHRRGRGTVRGFPGLFRRAGEVMRTSGRAELKTDISKIIGRAFRKRGYRSRL